MNTLLFNKLLITIRLCASQLKVAMSNRYRIPSLMKQVEHDHGIQPSAYSQKDFIGSFAKLVAGNVIMKKL